MITDIYTLKLGDLVEFQRGYDLPKFNFVEGKYPVVSSNGILGYHNEYKVIGPGITIGRSGTVGLPHYYESNFFPHNTTLFIKDFKGNNSKYIFYLIKNLKLNNQGTGSGVPTMNRNHLHPLKIKAHKDVQVQQKIAAVLSALDSKIELNNRINAELEAMAKTLYDYWFVQFDFPNAKGKPYKSSGGKMVWNKELKRNIPYGWGVGVISNIVMNTKEGVEAGAHPILPYIPIDDLPMKKLISAQTSVPSCL
jgi:type I restriction enzyme S subunit